MIDLRERFANETKVEIYYRLSLGGGRYPRNGMCYRDKYPWNDTITWDGIGDMVHVISTFICEMVHVISTSICEMVHVISTSICEMQWYMSLVQVSVKWYSLFIQVSVKWYRLLVQVSMIPLVWYKIP